MQKQMDLNVNPDDLKDVKCECGNTIFKKVSFFKLLPAIMSPSGQEMAIENILTVCHNCSKRLEEAIKHAKRDKNNKIIKLNG